MSNDNRYAVLIDADNISDRYIKVILDEISNYGVATYKRIYGDWTKPGLGNWKTVLLEHSVTPIQQYGYTTGKNATDSAMIIDAMDILYSGNVEGFCLVTSDSDFTRLAARMRESGMDVVGMGEKKTPKPFISACNRFKYLDILANTEEIAVKNVYTKTKAKENFQYKKVAVDADGEMLGSLEEIKRAIITLVEENPDEDEWLFIGDLGNKLQ
ncbi:MAG: NYN domain-containing protein, partial [Anaerovoracaceae bacterium]